MKLSPALVLFALLTIPGPLPAEPLTLPPENRPAWLARDGIVMAGSWEPLVFRVRRDGAGYTPTPEQLAGYRREHSPEMVARLKALGVNFVMTHCYKGAGLEAEREGMADAVRFAKLCHDAGMRVGVYNYSGAFLWELFFKEVPQAKDWVVLDARGQPLTYGRAGYRYYWNRNHPEAEAFYRKLVRFAVEEIRTDLVHFDNYVIGPGYEEVSVARFRRYLREEFSSAELAAMGVSDVQSARPPGPGTPELLTRAWLDFCSRSLAESYHAMGRYARSLRPDVLVECNPGGVGGGIRPPVDHGRMLQGGEAYWVESGRIGYRDGRLVSRIRNYKVGRAMDNLTFDYTLTPLEMAESMAFNLDCLGCICWFEYGKIVAMPGSPESMLLALEPYVRFFHKRHDLLRGASVVADVAVLRSFPSQAFGGPKYSGLTSRVEELLVESRGCFQIIHDHQLDDLKRYHALVLAGCVALGDRQIEAIRRYVAGGGRVCVIGPLATHDQWMRPRPKPALDDLPASAVVRAAETDDLVAAIGKACSGAPSLSISAGDHRALPAGLCAELTQQSARRLVHLVNYRSDGPVRDLALEVRLPSGSRAKAVTLASPDRRDDRSVEFQQESGKVRFTVPEVKVYEIAVVELD
jgi:Glycosyl hydrolase-like 10